MFTFFFYFFAKMLLSRFLWTAELGSLRNLHKGESLSVKLMYYVLQIEDDTQILQK